MKVTVITVCWNAAADLKLTIDALLAQTFTDWEYLVIDGGSQDATVGYLQEYEPRFREKNIPFRWISEKDHGTYDAMNKGARMAQGEYINYMNAGDRFYEETSLEKFFSHEIEAGAGVLYGDTFQVYDFGSGIARKDDYRKDNPIMPFCHQSCFVRTDLMKAYPFNTAYRIVADYDLFLRLTEAGIKFQYIQEVVARYNGQYGLSANNPLRLRMEGLKVHHYDGKWYYPLMVVKTYLRYGWIAWVKKHLPTALSDAWMKHKRKNYIK